MNKRMRKKKNISNALIKLTFTETGDTKEEDQKRSSEVLGVLEDHGLRFLGFIEHKKDGKKDMDMLGVVWHKTDSVNISPYLQKSVHVMDEKHLKLLEAEGIIETLNPKNYKYTQLNKEDRALYNELLEELRGRFKD